MDELSPLFQEIEFHERYRGYDPEEVDAFVDRVARAAAVMRGRIAELHERVDAAEARSTSTHAHSDAEATLTRTLVLAQRTADAAIAEAREEADRITADAATSAQAILSATEAEAQITMREAQSEASATLKEAEDRSGLMLAEAETDRRAMVAQSELLASEAAAVERERLAAEVSELHEYRAFLADDIEILERHLTEERHQLTVSASALTDLLESPEAFRVSRPPELSGVEIDADMIASMAESEFSGDGELLPESAAAEPATDDSITLAEEPLVEEVAAAEIPAAGMPADDVAYDEPVIEEISAETFADSDPEIEPEAEEEAVLAPVFRPTVEPEAEDETIDLVAAESLVESPARPEVEEPAYTEIDLADPEPDPEPGPGAPARIEPAPSEPAFAGMAESSLADAPPVEPAPALLVTAADLDAPAQTSGRLGFESSTFDQPIGDGGPVTEAVPALAEGSLFAEPEIADDPFLAQLRDAMDREPVPERDDDALTAFFDQEDDDGGRSWFGRRR